MKNIDKVLVAAILGVEYAGIYAAYYTVAVVASAKAAQLIGNVAFPTLSNQPNIADIFHKTKHIFLLWGIPLFVAACVGMSALMWLYGSKYPFHLAWIILLSLYVVIHFFASLFGWMLASRSKEGYKRQNYAHIVGLILYSTLLATSYFWFHYFSITLVITALLVYRAYAGVAYVRALRKLG